MNETVSRLLRAQSLWMGAVLIGLPWLLYAPALTGEFVYDDIAITVLENPLLHGEVSLAAVWLWERPVREFTYLLDYTLWGWNPVGYHVQNLVWHIANGLLLFALCRRLHLEPMPSFWVALLFLAHPVQTESVAWISGRKELLCLFFQLAALHALLASITRPLWMTAVVGLFVLALLSKQVAIVFPAVAAGVWMMGAVSAGTPVRVGPLAWRVAALVAVALVYLVFHSGLIHRLESIQQDARLFDPASRDVAASWLTGVLTPFAVWDAVLQVLICPLDLTIERAFPPVMVLADPRWMFGLLWLVLGSLVAVVEWRRQPFVFLGWFWMLLAWVPVSGILPLSYLLADRYLYIPAVGFCLVAVGLTQRALRSVSCGLTPPAIAVLVFFSVVTLDRSLDWRTGISLWESAAASRPANPKVFSGLGNAYQRKGRTEEAFSAWRRSLELDPRQPNVWLNMGLAERKQNDLDAAEDAYRNALRIEPAYGLAMYNLAFVYEMRGDTETARQLFLQSTRAMTGEVNQQRRRGIAHYQAARLFALDNDWSAARTHLLQAERFAPGHAPLYTLKGQMPGLSPNQARSAFQQAIRLDPNQADAWFNLGVLEWQQGNPARAEQLWSEAIRLQPAMQSRLDSIRNQKN